MTPRKRLGEDGAAFVMSEGDRFHRIIVSDGVHHEGDADAETILTFFVIRRASGSFDVVNVNRTFMKGIPVSRTVQTKVGITADRIADEIDAVRIGFAVGIEKVTGYKLKWHELDLSGVEDQAEQVASIKAWGRVGVTGGADGAVWN